MVCLLSVLIWGSSVCIGIGTENSLEEVGLMQSSHLTSKRLTPSSTGEAYTYKPDAYMNLTGDISGKFYGLLSLSSKFQGPEAAFNPSLIQLPTQKWKALHPDAAFVATLRHFECQCPSLAVGDATTRLCQRNTRDEEDIGTSVALLDCNFQILATGKIQGSDHKLLAVDNSLLTSFQSYYPSDLLPQRGWHLAALELRMDGPSLTARLQDLSFPGMHGKLSQPLPNRNLGVIPKDSAWTLLENFDSWPKPVTRAVNLSEMEAETEQPGWWLQQPPALESAYRHNSIHPLALPELNALLGIVHWHGPSGKHQARHGSDYYHKFILMEDKHPFGIKKQGSAFCLPALNSAHASECETIQFVGSVVRDPVDSGTLLIAYGINDCEAALARVALKSILDDLTVLP